MPIIKPTYEELRDKVYANIAGKVCPDQPFMVGGLIRIISEVIAYIGWSIFEFSDRLGRTPWDASGQLLLNYGLSCGISPNSETCAQGLVNLSGTGEIPPGSILVRCDGCEYETIEQTVTLQSQVTVRALECGSNCNSPNGTILTFSNAPPGINSTAQVATDGLVGGADAETEEQFRLRVLSCLANPCRTGLKSDYDFWTRLHPGVTRVCCDPQDRGCGTIKIYFMMDDTYADGIPAQGDVEAVQDILDENAPLGICTTACAPTPIDIDVSIKVQRSTSQERMAIRDALIEFFRQIECETLCQADLIRVVGDVFNGCFEICEPTTEELQFGINQVPILGTVKFFNL